MSHHHLSFLLSLKSAYLPLGNGRVQIAPTVPGAKDTSWGEGVYFGLSNPDYHARMEGNEKLMFQQSVLDHTTTIPACEQIADICQHFPPTHFLGQLKLRMKNIAKVWG
jgi:hypothetical protein